MTRSRRRTVSTRGIPSGDPYIFSTALEAVQIMLAIFVHPAELCEACGNNKKEPGGTMRLALPSHWIGSRAIVQRLRQATTRALPYLLLGLVMLGYVLVAISQGWL